MASTSETGHAKNVANLDTLISAITSYGAVYNPSRAALKLPALQTLSTSAKASLTSVNTQNANASNAIAARDLAFAPLSKLVTKISNAIKATETSTQVDDNVSTIIRKLQGRRATPLLSEEQKTQKTAEGKTVNQISVSQLSFDSKIENLDKLIKILASIPLYAPNENELKVATLTTLYTDLKTKNTAVITAQAALNTARISRNEILYKPITGLLELAIAAKTYIKSIYGASSPQYTQIGKLSFKTSLRS